MEPPRTDRRPRAHAPRDTLLVTHLDRLGRNLHETVTTIADLSEREINVQVLDPALDTFRPADKVVVYVIASLAEWERELLVERTREDVAHARTQGALQSPNPSSATNKARQARQIINSGESIASVAQAFDRSGIQRLPPDALPRP